MRGWIATVLTALLLQAGAAGADEPAAEAAFNQANQALVDAVHRAAAEKSEPPRLADPAGAAVLRAAFDERVLTPLDETNAEGAAPLCETGGKSLQAYLFFGSASTDFSQTETVSRNALRFQDEAALGMVFSLACTERMVRAAELFWAKLPDDMRKTARDQGVVQMREGIAEMYSGVIISQSDPLTQANKDALLDAAIAHVDFFVGVLSPKDRGTVIASIDETLPSPSLGADAKSKLQRIRDAMARTDCTGFCAV